MWSLGWSFYFSRQGTTITCSYTCSRNSVSWVTWRCHWLRSWRRRRVKTVWQWRWRPKILLLSKMAGRCLLRWRFVGWHMHRLWLGSGCMCLLLWCGWCLSHGWRLQKEYNLIPKLQYIINICFVVEKWKLLYKCYSYRIILFPKPSCLELIQFFPFVFHLQKCTFIV